MAHRTSSAAPASRPIHPCVLSLFEGSNGGEYATWAHLTTSKRSAQLPNLVTAQNNSIRVYQVEETSGTLILVHSFPNLAGSVCFLETLSVDDDSIDDGDEESFDSLIIGFSGHPRLVVAAVASSAASSAICASPTLLLATSLLDLTAALVEHSLGSVSPLEHDLIASIKSQRHQVTLCVVLGNGVAVATISLRFSKIKAARSETTSNEWQKSGWIAGEPYLLPLANLQRSLHDETFDSASRSDNIRSASLGHAISTGFGDILSAAFLPGYLEPTVVLLHSNPVQGRTWSGRLGRPNGSGGARGCLLVTAIIVTVPHRQSALLWSIEVPTDAISLHPIGTSGVLVVSVNSILVVTNSGRIDQMIAVNGWARSGCPTRLLGMLLPNPWPFPKLAIQLDGARLCMVSDKAGFVALRNGQLYLLQKCDRWSLTPIGQTLGAIGEIAALLPWRFGDVPRKFSPSWTKSDNATQMSLGLLFAGSRLGDSHLLGYVLESNVSVVDFVKQDDSSTKIKIEDTTETSTVGLPLQANRDTNGGELDREGILLLEEAALYAADDSSVDTSPHTIPPSDDETESLQEQGSPSRKRQRSMLSKLTVTRSLLALDTITSLGPIGPGCEGPLSPPPSESRLIMPLDTTAGAVSGATAHVFPCGYGSSGGLALVTAPGRDDRSILAEADCLNVECLFSLPRSGLLLLGMSRSETGIKALRFSEVGDPTELDEEATVGMREINLEEWLEGEQNDDSHVFGRANNLFRDATLLAAAEIGAGKFFIVVSAGVADDAEYAIVSLVENDGVLTVSHHFQLTDGEKRSVLLSLTPLIYQQEKGLVSFCCLWNSGNANAVSISADSIVWEGKIRNLDPEGANQSPSFFESLKVVAVDLFEAPVDIFSTPFSCGDGCKDRPTLVKSDDSTTEEIYEFDDDDFELYGTNRAWSHANEKEDSHATVEPKRLSLFVAICRQSGKLEVYSLTDIQSGDDESPLWFANGCGHGVTHITSQKEHRKPVVHEVHTCEMRFFSCGPSPLERTGSFESPLHSLALLIETSDEDLFLYKAEFHQRPSKSLEFRRVPLGMVSRRSQEQTRHHAKLRRKAIVGGANVDSFDLSSFRHSRLHRFTCLSGQDGAFAAVSRPLWILSERGKLTPLCHRTRHAAPAGGRPWPVVGFCPEVPLANSESSNRAFMTLHERVGRVGSQRLTIFRSISNLLTPNGLLPGGGYFVEKIPLGVTVKRIEFIDDSETSSGSHPLYAVLVARELAADQRALNDDGLTAEERQKLKDEKEAAKIKRQVEADLGGFDLEQEWVEEIEREDCFKVEISIGGAPPNPSSAYSLWVVDAARKWNVVDSFEFGEFEYGMTMRIMPLTEFGDDAGIGGDNSTDDVSNTLLLCVGTGRLTQDGEDVSSKGRLLLFKVKRPDKESLLASSQVAELSLVYEKEILHGPVSSLSCLASEGRNRLVIGAGADVNVEQWGDGRLTQVGFFRATMQILDISLFRNFFLLSDAYDSLYFLVWRESDKSLTLLAKDYEPIAVYAAGILSRGGSLTFVCHDDRQNLQFFQYAPGDAAARGGNKLVCRADFHLGSQSIGLQSHMCRSSLLICSATHSSTLAALKQQDALFGRSDDDQRIGLYFGTSDGSSGSIVPLSEPVYWRLAALQSVMGNALETDCGLSQRAWRLYRRTPRRGGCRANDRKKGVIDGELVFQFANLALSDQEDLASAIGSSVDLILDNLLELKCASMII